MKRYKMAIGGDEYIDRTYYINTIEDPDGEWVRYEDVKLMIETKPPEITIESIECNCFHMVHLEEVKKTSWICPAHGYKKL